VAALAALANETRYELVRLLHIAGEELCVCELTAVAEVSDSGVSHALRKLREAGLVTARKEGRWKYYQTTDRATALIIALEGTK
jgi:DNA-binding transcriptional ArsR family regulator